MRNAANLNRKHECVSRKR